MIGFRCWHDAGKRWKLNDGMDVRLNVAVVCVCGRGVVCCDSWRSRGWSGLAMMETEGGKVWVAASCTVVCLAAAVGIG